MSLACASIITSLVSVFDALALQLHSFLYLIHLRVALVFSCFTRFIFSCWARLLDLNFWLERFTEVDRDRKVIHILSLSLISIYISVIFFLIINISSIFSLLSI